MTCAGVLFVVEPKLITAVLTAFVVLVPLPAPAPTPPTATLVPTLPALAVLDPATIYDDPPLPLPPAVWLEPIA